jgi:Rps23 Pro-64 3,4-dihydroxylase Tpa1-like proline 4-hydroxylase
MIANEIAMGTFSQHPFPYFVVGKGLTNEASTLLLNWFEGEAPWNLIEAEFYEQYEFDLRSISLPEIVRPICGWQNLLKVKSFVESVFKVQLTDRIDLTAHKLLPGQKIRIHNDFIPGAETHRVLIQLNRGWSDENGGLLMFFNSTEASDIHRAFRPVHNSCVAFAISPLSLHAVSTIHASERYTLVYSFYELQQ